MEPEHRTPGVVALEADGELRGRRALGDALHGHHCAGFIPPGHVALEGHLVRTHERSGEDERKEHAVVELGDLLEVAVGAHVVDLLGELDELEGPVQLVVHVDLEASLQHRHPEGEALARLQWVLWAVALPVLRDLLLLPSLARLEHAADDLALAEIGLDLQEHRFALVLRVHIVREVQRNSVRNSRGVISKKY